MCQRGCCPCWWFGWDRYDSAVQVKSTGVLYRWLVGRRLHGQHHHIARHVREQGGDAVGGGLVGQADACGATGWDRVAAERAGSAGVHSMTAQGRSAIRLVARCRPSGGQARADAASLASWRHRSQSVAILPIRIPSRTHTRQTTVRHLTRGLGSGTDAGGPYNLRRIACGGRLRATTPQGIMLTIGRSVELHTHRRGGCRALRPAQRRRARPGPLDTVLPACR